MSPTPENVGQEEESERPVTAASAAAAAPTARAPVAARKAAPRKPAARKPAARKAPARRAPAKTAAAKTAAATVVPIATARVKSAPAPVVQDTAGVEPVVAEPVVAEPVVEEAVVAAPVSDAAVGAEPVFDEPVVDEPVLPGPAAEEVSLIEPEPVREPELALEPEPVADETQATEATDVFTDAATAILPSAPPTDLFGTLLRGEQSAHVAEVPHAHPIAPPQSADVVLSIQRLRKTYGATVALDAVSLDVRAGSFYGIVGPNGAGKTTTLSIIAGLLRPDAGAVWVHGVDVWRHPSKAKRSIGVLPDRLRLFDRLTGAQFLRYAGTLRGLDAATVNERAADLAAAFGLEDALGRLVADYSAGMTKKVALAAAMIHSPRLLILDEPFESVDPVSAANVIEILQKYVSAGGTVVLSSHGMDLIQRVCDSVAIIVTGRVLASGTVDEVRGRGSLEDRFVELAGGRKAAEGLEWLHSFSD